MSGEALPVLAIMAAAFTLCVRNAVPPEITALCAIAALALTGVLDTVTHRLSRLGGGRRQILVVFAVVPVLSAFMNNTPVAVQVARQLGFEPMPFVVSVMFGASCDFCTPFGYQTKLFVFGPGGYRFMDYPRIGVPLTAVLFAVSMVVIPWWFPFASVSP